MGLPCSSDGRESACNAGDLGSVPGSGRSPGEGNGSPLQHFCLESYGHRSLVGYNPQGCRRVTHNLVTKHHQQQVEEVKKCKPAELN